MSKVALKKIYVRREVTLIRQGLGHQRSILAYDRRRLPAYRQAGFHDEVNVDGVLFEPTKGELYAVVNRVDENAEEIISEHIF